MNNYKHLKNVLNFNIRKLTNLSFPFRENPDSDFTRNRKLDFELIMKNVVCMEIGSLKDELLKIHDYSVETPTVFAFIHDGDKIKVDVFKISFDKFNQKTK